MKRLVLSTALAAIMTVMTGCYEGSAGSDGTILRQYLEPAALKALVESPRSDIWIIDVRPASAFKKGHVPTAKNFPSGEIMKRLAELPKTQYLILM